MSARPTESAASERRAGAALGPPMLAAVLTPFDAAGEVDPEPLAAHLRWLLDGGLDGVLACGTTGEGALLDDDEVARVCEVALEAAAGRAEVVAHVGRPSTRHTLRLARRVIELGVHAIAAVTPYYFAAGDDDLERHYQALLGAAGGVPVFAYTIPRAAHNELAPDVVGRLAAAGLAGLKDSSGSLELHRAYQAATAGAEGFRLMTGTDDQVVEALGGGSAGSMTGLANLAPAGFSALRDAWAAGDQAGAARAQAELEPARRAVAAAAVGGPPPGGVKRATAERLASEGIEYPARRRAPWR